MADKKIEDATRVSSVNGAEILPASVSSAAKSLTTEQIAGYVTYFIAGLSDASSSWGGDDTNDRFIVKNGSTLSRITKNALVDLVFNALTGKDAATTLTDSDIIIVKNDSTEKTTTLGAIKTYVAAAFSGNMDIHSLDAADEATSTDELAVYKAATDDEEAGNKKVTMDQVATAVCGEISGKATSSSAALANTDNILFCDASGNLKKVAKQDAGLGADGDVTGPSANTDAFVPQWDGTNSKTLKNGLQVATSLTNASDAQVPTAKAVKDAVDAVTTANNITMSGTATAGVIPVMTGTDKAADNGTSKVTSIGSSPTDAQIPTAKAVDDYVYGACAKKPTIITDGALAKFSGTDGQLANGPSVVTSVSALSTDSQVPTAKAVNDAVTSAGGTAITAASIPAAGTVPYFASASRAATTKTLATTMATTLAGGSNDKVLTEKAVTDVLYGEASSTRDAFLKADCLTATASQYEQVPVIDDADGSCKTYPIDNDSSSVTSIATVGMVKTKVGNAKGLIYMVAVPFSQLTSGYENGTLVYSTSADKLGLNIGTNASPQWVEFTPDAS